LTGDPTLVILRCKIFLHCNITEVSQMINQMQDFMNEQIQVLTGQAQQLGADPLAAMRQGLGYSVDGLKALEQPIRVASRTGVQLTSVYQQAFESLIELQTEMVTSSLNDVAGGLERAAAAKDVATLATVQADTLRASAERFVNDANRALEIFTAAGRGVQKIAGEAYEQAARTAGTAPRAARTGTTRKTKRARKPAAKKAAA
jgi:phasin family protein